MTNIVSLLLALALTGSPVASVVCVAARQLETATAGHCHGDTATSGGSMMAAGSECSDPSISEGPYLQEHRALTGAIVLTTASCVMATTQARTTAPVVLATAADAWLKLRLVLRI
jgi:hypothetical protein